MSFNLQQSVRVRNYKSIEESLPLRAHVEEAIKYYTAEAAQVEKSRDEIASTTRPINLVNLIWGLEFLLDRINDISVAEIAKKNNVGKDYVRQKMRESKARVDRLQKLKALGREP